jgi:hypothetical protein
VKRRQLFEFTDLPWWPPVFRALLTDFLMGLSEKTTPFSRKVDLLARAVRSGKKRKVVDLCSGGGGPWFHLAAQLNKALGEPVEIILTDRFPNEEAMEKIKNLDGVSYYGKSVNALDVPEELTGTRTLFDGFHHFSPKDAQGILEDAIKKGEPIAIFELASRTIPDVLAMALTPLNVLLITPTIFPWKASRMFFTYVIPVAPLVIAWDGAVSMMRCYTPDEMLEMARKADTENKYEWEAGDYKVFVFTVTYMVGALKEVKEDNVEAK